MISAARSLAATTSCSFSTSSRARRSASARAAAACWLARSTTPRAPATISSASAICAGTTARAASSRSSASALLTSTDALIGMPRALVRNCVSSSMIASRDSPFGAWSAIARPGPHTHEARRDGVRHEPGDVAAVACDVLHEGGRDVVEGGVTHDEDRFDAREVAIEQAHAQLGVEVGGAAQALDDGAGTLLPAVVREQPADGLHLHAVEALDGLARQRDALVGGEQVVLGRVVRHRHDDLVEEAQGAAHHVHVSKRDGVVRSGAHGEGGHAHQTSPRPPHGAKATGSYPRTCAPPPPRARPGTRAAPSAWNAPPRRRPPARATRRPRGRRGPRRRPGRTAVSYTHLRAHETRHDLVCRLLLEKTKKRTTGHYNPDPPPSQ